VKFLRGIKLFQVVLATGAFLIITFVQSDVLLLFPFIKGIAAIGAEIAVIGFVCPVTLVKLKLLITNLAFELSSF